MTTKQAPSRKPPEPAAQDDAEERTGTDDPPSDEELFVRAWSSGGRLTQFLECEQRFEHGR